MAVEKAGPLTAASESDALRFWNETFFETFCRIAYRYGADPAVPYPFYEIRRDHVLSLLNQREVGRLLDVGCGGGHVMEALRTRGWSSEGCDFSPRMLAFARQRLSGAGWNDAPLRVCAATDLSAYSDGTFDAVLCLGPIEYLAEEEARRAYDEMRRVLLPQGVLVCAHINALFDLFTLDGFTADFLICSLGKTYRMAPEAQAEIAVALNRRLGGGDRSGSIRSRVATRTDNPLSIGDTLDRCGFKLQDKLFYRFYMAPPAVLRALGRHEAEAVTFEQELARAWQGHFFASSFLTLSVKH